MKDVTNRNDIKAAKMKIWFIPAVLNFPRKKAMFVVAYRVMLVCERVLVGREDCEISAELKPSRLYFLKVRM